MDSISKQLRDRAIKEGKIKEGKTNSSFLKLAVQIKDEDGNKKGVEGTGPHRVIFWEDKAVKGTDYITKQERDEVQYSFEENGIQKIYRVPVKNKEGNLHYFVERMAEIPRGSEVLLEYKKKEGSYRGYISVQIIKGPTDSFKEGSGEEDPFEGGNEWGNEGIDDEDIPVIEEEL
jgi:hypothetical protein